jgi:hypothetical protein
VRTQLLAVGTVLALTACGGGRTPAPEPVGQSLDRVESLLEAGRGLEARTALEDLVRRTLALRESGELDPEQAARIVAAATRLAQVLPSPRPAPTAAPTPTLGEDEGERGDDKGDGKGKGGGKGDDDKGDGKGEDGKGED